MSTGKTIIDELKGTATQIKDQVEKLIREGNARRVIVKNKEGKVLFESQLTIGLGGAAILGFSAPIITALSAVLLYATDVRVFIEKDAAGAAADGTASGASADGSAEGGEASSAPAEGHVIAIEDGTPDSGA